jgi:hypothetical protein
MADFYETMQQARADEDEAAMYAAAEAEMYRQQQEEHHGQQALEYAVATFGVPGVLRRLAGVMEQMSMLSEPIDEPF